MKYRIPAFCLFILSSLFIFSQGAFSYDIELQFVDFLNGYPMRMDDNSGNYSAAVEYELIGGGNYATAPVAYIAGNSFLARATFLTNCPASLFIRGKHIRPDGAELIFPAQEITPDGGELEYSPSQPLENGSTFTFPAGVAEFHDPFEIVWQFSTTDSPNDMDWMDIHTSANPLYVTRTFPNFSTEKKYHTYFRTSCKAADGLSDDDDIIAAVWAVFADKFSFARADDEEPLAYYGDWTNAAFHADEMVVDANGQCSAFSMAFLFCLKVQGINQSNDYMVINAELPIPDIHLGLIVNNYQNTATTVFDHWTNNTAPAVPQGFTIENVVIPLQGGNPYNFISSVFSENVLYADIEDMDGAEGQNNINPKSTFFNHQIIRLNDSFGAETLYDVPYGATYGSLAEMENNLYGYLYQTTAEIDETSLGYDVNGDGPIEESVLLTVWLIDTDPEGLELIPNVQNNF